MTGSADRWISWTTTGCMAVLALIAATAARELNATCAAVVASHSPGKSRWPVLIRASTSSRNTVPAGEPQHPVAAVQGIQQAAHPRGRDRHRPAVKIKCRSRPKSGI
jgi:hypothetical protein